MNRIFVTIIALVAGVLPAVAETEGNKAPGRVFYDKKISAEWSVFGNVYQVDKKKDACVAERLWKDGSRLIFVKDFSDGELYIRITNLDWNITDPPDTIVENLIINFFDHKKQVVGDNMTGGFMVLSKNVVVIGNLKEVFLERLQKSAAMRLSFPGTVANLGTIIPGKQILEGLVDCIDAYNVFKKNNKSKNQI